MTSDLYEKCVFPFIVQLTKGDPERAHTLTLYCLRLFERTPGLLPLIAKYCMMSDRRLERRCLRTMFPNPVGLAAGFVKNAEIYTILRALGFGFVEIGTVTPEPQSGNERPRITRVSEYHALINRMGFPNIGVKRVLARLRQQGNGRIPRGINIGPNKATVESGLLERITEDYVGVAKTLAAYADYFTINISSPNTPGLRQIMNAQALTHVIPQIRRVTSNAVPVLIKLSPDLDTAQLDEILNACETKGVAGYICVNTTLSRPAEYRPLSVEGGLSGPALRARMLEMVQYIRTQLPHTIIIGVGGVDSSDTVQQAFDRGANLVQLYTSLVYQGPMLIRKILASLR